MTITKGRTVREYLYPLGNEQRVFDTAWLAMRSGYVVEITPPTERRVPEMYVVRYKQLFPEGDWQICRGPTGADMVFHEHHDAARYAGDLMGEPKNLGYAFRVDQHVVADPDALAAADRREYEV